MKTLWKRFAPIFLILIAFTLIEGGLAAEYADARSKSGGKSFSSSPSPSKAPASAPAGAPATGGGFGRGLMGGLLGGAIGGMLFGSMFGGGGSGMGILPLLILGGVAFFLYRKFAKARQGAGNAAPNQYARQGVQPSGILPAGIFGGATDTTSQPPPPPIIGENLVDDGISQIKATDKNFDSAYFTEVASDVFFKVQAGWMRRELDSYRHLLGEQLAGEYAAHFTEMHSKGHINKLESIAVRGVEIIQAGSDGREDFVTVLFTANLLDYTVDDKSGALVSGNMTDPVKFREEWTWARPTGTQNWKLEGIKEG
ncbi:MAG: Tim44 domain-containing protein [Desulfocapsaceae bacterium]|nr:Tim44 domain-containing protein [Desulfocapsaceae bacterium]